MTSFQTLLTDVSGRVATIWLNRPERRNAFDADLERGGDTFNRPADAGRPAADPVRIEPTRMRTPIIAAMNGSAVGMGLTLPIGWDIRFAAAEAKYGFVFTRRGIVPEASSTWLLPRLIGVSRAMELLLSGRVFNGAEAAEMGLVSRALPAEDVLPVAQEFARDLAVNTSAVSVAAGSSQLRD